MECSSPEAVSSLSDCTFFEAFLECQGRRLSRDVSPPPRKNSKNDQSPRQTPDICRDASGHNRSCSVSFKQPLEDVHQLLETSGENTEYSGSGSSVGHAEKTSHCSLKPSNNRRDNSKHSRSISEGTGIMLEKNKQISRQRQSSETPESGNLQTEMRNLQISDFEHLRTTGLRKNSIKLSKPSDVTDQTTLDPPEENGKKTIRGEQESETLSINSDVSKHMSVTSKQKSDKHSKVSDLSPQSSVRSKQTSEKSTNTAETISLISGWSWQGSFRSSGRMSRNGSILSRKKSWRTPRFRSKSQGDRPERKEDDSSSTDPRVEMVPESGGCTTAQESANQAAQEILISSPGSSKARQKKFHRHFKTVPADEKVLNYYSCALVADILLQGHLYITRNYFAFYSNVFGYVTKLLIPTSTVLKVTKEKTAYIIPNAVGVTTEEDKHVFGSLLSRDNTYKLMVQVWNAALAPTPANALPKPEGLEDRLSEEPLEEPIQDEESSLSGSESNLESKLISNSVEPPPKGNTQTMGIEVKSYHDMFSQTTPGTRGPFLTFLRSLPRPTLLLLISTGLLVLLFASATVLLYRIARLHQAPDFSARSMSEVHAYINTNLEHITKVRESLEKLSFLIEHGKYHS